MVMKGLLWCLVELLPSVPSHFLSGVREESINWWLSDSSYIAGCMEFNYTLQSVSQSVYRCINRYQQQQH